MKKLFLIIGMLAVFTSVSQASGWKIISDELIGYNFYVDYVFLGKNL